MTGVDAGRSDVGGIFYHQRQSNDLGSDIEPIAVQKYYRRGQPFVLVSFRRVWIIPSLRAVEEKPPFSKLPYLAGNGIVVIRQNWLFGRHSEKGLTINPKFQMSTLNSQSTYTQLRRHRGTSNLEHY